MECSNPYPKGMKVQTDWRTASNIKEGKVIQQTLQKRSDASDPYAIKNQANAFKPMSNND